MILIFFLFHVYAAQIIDLGNLEIEGEVRRPMLDYLDVDRNAKDAAIHIALLELKLLEQNMINKKAQKTQSGPIDQLKKIELDLLRRK